MVLLQLHLCLLSLINNSFGVISDDDDDSEPVIQIDHGSGCHTEGNLCIKSIGSSSASMLYH